jgi:hypothetical protein
MAQLDALGHVERLYGWEPNSPRSSGATAPLSAAGQGTQSWLYMPLIGLALEDLEEQEGRAPIGERAAVPWTQRGFWTRACHAAAHDTTNTLAAFLPDVLPARRRTNLLEALSQTLRNNRAYPTLSGIG